MGSNFYLIVVISIYILCAQSQQPKDCIKGDSGRYNGTISTTASGRTCQRWDVDIPHKVKKRPLVYNHNYCRNPDADLRDTWCYTTDNDARWEYCNISKCPDDSYLYWTSFDQSREQTMILKTHADPEFVTRVTDTNGIFIPTNVVNSSSKTSEYWSLTAHPRRKLLFYTDYKLRYLGVWDIDKGEEKRYFEGMTHGFESLAIDWKTDNLYWTDSTFNWVMVSDSHFKHYTPVYRTAPDPPYGLVVHSERRYIIFSIYKSLNSSIIRTDLTGKNAVVLFSYPDVLDVTGITIDYAEDRLYWNDFTGYGGVVMSSRFDGTNKTQHYYRGGSIFWASVTFNNYVYISDVHSRYDDNGEKFYYLWFIPKWRAATFRYKLSGKPRGVTITNGIEEAISIYDSDSDFGECSENTECDQICLPRINSSSECACSLGYYFNATSKRCTYNLLENNYLLFADSGQGRVFQIPIDGAVEENRTFAYNIVPLDGAQNIETVTLDMNRGYVFWSSKQARSLFRANIDGKNRIKIADTYASGIAVDPQTGNVFYVDEHSNAIVVSKGDGSFSTTITTFNSTTERNSTIKMITIDIEYKYIYWTEQVVNRDMGRVMRCRFDGSEAEVVLDGMEFPHAITIDYQNGKIYVMETKEVKIFETELSLLETISNTSTGGSNIRAYDLSRTFGTTYTLDIKVIGGTAYIAGGRNVALRTFNFTSRMAPYFGPSEFVRISAMSIYEKSYYKDYIEPLRDPCSTNTCRGLCLAINASNSLCLCGEGEMDTDCDIQEDAATTEESTDVMAKEYTSRRPQPQSTTSMPRRRHEDLDNFANRFWATILRVFRLCNSENSPCF